MNEKVKTLISFTLNCIDKSSFTCTVYLVYQKCIVLIRLSICVLFFFHAVDLLHHQPIIFWGAFVFSQVVRDLHMEIILLIIVDKISVVIFFSYYYYYYFIFFLYLIIFPYKNIIAKKFAI